MNKKLLSLLVIAISTLSITTLTSCGEKDSNNGGAFGENINQLATVQNVKYDEDNYKIVWDKVTNADSYNVKVGSDNITFIDIKTNEFEFYPKNAEKNLSIEIQAIDSTGSKDKSSWSKAYTYTLTKTDTLISSVMDYANNNINGYLKKFVSAYNKDFILVMNVITNKNGKDNVTEILSDIKKDVDTSSLVKVIESNPEMYSSKDYTLAVDENGKAYNSMSYLLKSNIDGTKLKKWMNNGFKVEVISSYDALNYNDPEGNNFTITTTLKLTNGNDVRYFAVDYGCHIKYPSNLEENVTYSLQNTSDRSVSEGILNELKGDYIEVL